MSMCHMQIPALTIAHDKHNLHMTTPFPGTIFGVYEQPAEATATDSVLQPGHQLLMSGYALYSSATMLVITTGQGTHGFTLDPQWQGGKLSGEFVLTHPNIRIPQRGQIYSVNDARYHDWPRGLQQYIDDIRMVSMEHCYTAYSIHHTPYTIQHTHCFTHSTPYTCPVWWVPLGSRRYTESIRSVLLSLASPHAGSFIPDASVCLSLHSQFSVGAMSA